MPQDASLPPEPLSLTEASVQEIQLELIRRWRFNCFDGPKIVASLRRHRSLWRGAFMDRLGFVSQEGQSNFGLIKLRDLPANHWNVDDLFILTDTLEQARQWQQIAIDEEWSADNTSIIEDEDDRARQLGTSRPGYVVDFWWD
jgi:hypothetical protein